MTRWFGPLPYYTGHIACMNIRQRICNTVLANFLMNPRMFQDLTAVLVVHSFLRGLCFSAAHYAMYLHR